MDEKKNIDSIDGYIAGFDPSIREVLNEMRKIIQEAAPEATEKISYQMPTFYYLGNLVHFAAFKSHIGLYPLPEAMEIFADRLKTYKTGKGSVQFPLNQPLPADLIRDIVKFRLAENIRSSETRKASEQKKKVR